MQRLVIDTNVYVDWLNVGHHEAVLFQRDAVKYLSAIVVMELYAGAFTPRDRRIIGGVVSAFRRTGRVLVPPGTVYEEAGHVLRSLQRDSGYDLARAHSLANDVLIALSARAIGATVVTRNQRDFTAIQAVRQFSLALLR